jgi:hypothetical protein
VNTRIYIIYALAITWLAIACIDQAKKAKLAVEF